VVGKQGMKNNNNKYKSAHWAVYRGATMSTKNRRRSTDLEFTGINVAITIIKKRVISPKISFFVQFVLVTSAIVALRADRASNLSSQMTDDAKGQHHQHQRNQCKFVITVIR